MSTMIREFTGVTYHLNSVRVVMGTAFIEGREIDGGCYAMYGRELARKGDVSPEDIRKDVEENPEVKINPGLFSRRFIETASGAVLELQNQKKLNDQWATQKLRSLLEPEVGESRLASGRE